MSENKKEEMLYSQTQIASNLKISQSTVTRLLKKNGLRPVKNKDKAKLYSKDQIETLNLSILQQKERLHRNADNYNLLMFFQNEIRELHSENKKLEKNYVDQLKSKDEQIAALHKLLNQNQQLLLNTQKENKHLLSLQSPSGSTQDVYEGDYKENTHITTESPQKSTENVTDNTMEREKRWWEFWKQK